MLPKKQRLSVRQFDTVWRRGTTTCGAFVCIRYLFGTTDTRISVTAPKKLSKTAVKRNSVRRKLYSAIEQCVIQQSLPLCHIIITPTKTIDKVAFNRLFNDLFTVLKKIRVICYKK